MNPSNLVYNDAPKPYEPKKFCEKCGREFFGAQFCITCFEISEKAPFQPTLPFWPESKND